MRSGAAPNPFPHVVALNVDHCVVDPIKEASPSLSLPVLSKVSRSFVHPSPPPPTSTNSSSAAAAIALAGPVSVKALAKAAKPGPTALPPGKNAIMFLNEHLPGLPFECVARIGPDNKPTFSMKVGVIR